MAGLKSTDQSPFADGLLLGSLFLPFVPIITTFDLYLLRFAFSCPQTFTLPCRAAGVDLNVLFAMSSGWLKIAAEFAGSAYLLFYLLLVATLAQLTISGFRGRVVRTCAVIMWAGILPLVLALASALVHGPSLFVKGPLTSFALYGRVFFDWLTNVAVPLAVLTTLLLALTLGYRMLIGRLVSLATRKNT